MEALFAMAMSHPVEGRATTSAELVIIKMIEHAK